MTDNPLMKTRDRKVLERELDLITNPKHKEAALAVVEMHKVFGEILPASAQTDIKRYILSAVRYIRRKLPGEVFTPESFADAVFDAAQYGLAIDGRLAYALPYASKDEKSGAKILVFVPDYKGIVAAAKQFGIVKDVRAYVVRAGDDFILPGEDSEKVGVHWRYRPALGDRGDAIGALCVIEFPDGRRHPEFMSEEEIKVVRNAAKTQKVWSAFPDEMRKKTVIKRAFKLHQDDPKMSSLLEAGDNEEFQFNAIPGTRDRTLTLPKVKVSRAQTANIRPSREFIADDQESTPKENEPASTFDHDIDTSTSSTVDAERKGLLQAFADLWGDHVDKGLDVEQLYGVTKDTTGTSTADLADLVAMMSEALASEPAQ